MMTKEEIEYQDALLDDSTGRLTYRLRNLGLVFGDKIPIGRVAAAFVALDRKERKVINLRFGLANDYSLTLTETAKQFGITRERIRLFEKATLEKMRKSIEESGG